MRVNCAGKDWVIIFCRSRLVPREWAARALCAREYSIWRESYQGASPARNRCICMMSVNRTFLLRSIELLHTFDAISLSTLNFHCVREPSSAFLWRIAQIKCVWCSSMATTAASQSNELRCCSVIWRAFYWFMGLAIAICVFMFAFSIMRLTFWTASAHTPWSQCAAAVYTLEGAFMGAWDLSALVSWSGNAINGRFLVICGARERIAVNLETTETRIRM